MYKRQVKTFDNQTADGIVVLAVEAGSQFMIDVIQLHAAFHKPGAFAHFLNQLRLVLVIFIPDFSDNFLQKVFQGNHTNCGTVLI